MTSKLYVGNLPPDTKEKELRDLFGSFGDVEEVAVFNKEDGPGFAFVHFDKQSEAETALDNLDKTELHSYTIIVQISRTRGHGYGRGSGPPMPPGMRGPPRDRDRDRYHDSRDRYGGRDSYRDYHRGRDRYSESSPRDYGRSYRGRERGGYRRGRDYGYDKYSSRYDRYEGSYYEDYGSSRYSDYRRSRSPTRDYYRFDSDYDYPRSGRSYKEDRDYRDRKRY